MPGKEVVDHVVQLLLDLNDYPSDDDRAMEEDFLKDFVPFALFAPDFTITTFDVANWLQMGQRGHHTLKQNYFSMFKEGRDYKITKEISGAAGGRPSQKIWLTRDAAKRLMTVTDMPRSKQVLTYFITMENIASDRLVTGIENKMDHDEAIRSKGYVSKAKKPIRGQWEKGHCVYVIKCIIITKEGSKVIWKVGRTNDLNRRANEHYHGLVGFEEVVHQKLCPNNKYLEDCVLMRLGLDRIDTETVVSDPQEVLGAIERCIIARAFVCEGGKCPETDEEENSKCLVDNKYCSAYSIEKTAKDASKSIKRSLSPRRKKTIVQLEKLTEENEKLNASNKQLQDKLEKFEGKNARCSR
jgi:hypothetical protein